MGLAWQRVAAVAAFAIIFFQHFCYSEKAPFKSFAKDARLAPSAVYYDYIVIGGGTSGCAIAATLSERFRVLVLERGGLPYDDPNVMDVRGWIPLLANRSPQSAQRFISEDGVSNLRGTVLGGSSAVNAGFYSRAQRDFVFRSGWDERLVNSSYRWVEDKVVFWPAMLQWQSAVRDGLLDAKVLPYNGFTFDHLNGTKAGGTIFDLGGTRHTSADLLEYAEPSRITVYLNATVSKILFDVSGKRKKKPRAIGVSYTDSNGKKHTAYLNKGSKNEIILAAGAIASPQLLMLSGVGPAKHLKSFGIDVVLDQPEVGQGMADNPMNGLIVPANTRLEISIVQAVGILRAGAYIEAGSPYLQLGWSERLDEVLGILLNATGQVAPPPSPDLSIFQGGLLFEKIMGPVSTGFLELNSTDPKENPKVTFNYFKEPEDMRRCVAGMTTIINLIESKAFSRIRDTRISVPDLFKIMASFPLFLRPQHPDTATNLERFCNDTVLTLWHYHGGCIVDTVVDHDYKVLGIDALRVVDASTFSWDSPGTNPQAAIMMLGRYMGVRILRERSKLSEIITDMADRSLKDLIV